MTPLNFIPHSRPTLGEEEAQAAARVVASGQLAEGPQTAHFEREFAAFLGQPHAIAASSGTAALHLVLAAMGIGPGDEVILPSFVCSALLNAVNYTGAEAVLADIEAATLNMDQQDAARRLSRRTKALIVPHMFGLPADLEANPTLSAFFDSLTIPNGNGNNINELWVDFSEETAATQIAIGLNPIDATIDVKPGNDSNSINPRLEGVIWVAIFSDGESLGDALQIDLSTVRFGTLGAAPDLQRVADLNRDGLSDLLLRFRMPESGLTCGDTEAMLTGRTYTSQRFVGIDSITTVGCPRVDRSQARSEQRDSERLRPGIGR